MFHDCRTSDKKWSRSQLDNWENKGVFFVALFLCLENENEQKSKNDKLRNHQFSAQSRSQPWAQNTKRLKCFWFGEEPLQQVEHWDIAERIPGEECTEKEGVDGTVKEEDEIFYREVHADWNKAQEINNWIRGEEKVQS